jgi:16S rRNA A1518/A1519 N6-dimethyltransferase RsmA/KsgA/DIM1 with predicted DNA glycosylase/AP lyase activity
MVILIQKDVGDRILNNNKWLMINDKLSTSNNTDNNSSNFLISSKNTSWHSSDILPTNLVFNSRFLVSSKKSSVLSLFVQKKCYVKEVLFVWKENFIPKPKIESSVLLFELHNLYNDVDDETFMNFIKKWFQEPRKKLLKNLVNAWYSKEKVLKTFKILWIDENIRGEDLDVKMWCKLLYWIISEHLKT